MKEMGKEMWFYNQELKDESSTGKYGLAKISMSVIMKSLEWYELSFSFMKSLAVYEVPGLF